MFSVAVPTLWNLVIENVMLAGSLLYFRHHLETHLFDLAYRLQRLRGFNHPMTTLMLSVYETGRCGVFDAVSDSQP